MRSHRILNVTFNGPIEYAGRSFSFEFKFPFEFPLELRNLIEITEFSHRFGLLASDELKLNIINGDFVVVSLHKRSPQSSDYQCE